MIRGTALLMIHTHLHYSRHRIRYSKTRSK